MSLSLAGRVWKDGTWWLAECPTADVMTQGKTRTDACLMLADAIESLVHQDGFKVTVRDVGDDGAVVVESNDPFAIAELVLKRRAPAGSSIRWKPDHDDPNSVDDLFANGAHVHLERMSNTHYWLGITIDGVTHHFDLHSKRKIVAFPRQPSPDRAPLTADTKASDDE